MTIRDLWRFVTQPPTDGPRATILLGLMAGGVFFWEGLPLPAGGRPGTMVPGRAATAPT